jgi:hypothetical protein
MFDMLIANSFVSSGIRTSFCVSTRDVEEFDAPGTDESPPP